MPKHHFDIDILHIDSDLIVINKPAGLLSVQDGYQVDLPHVKSILESKLGQLYVVHRLDKYTSGVMVLARNRETHKILNIQFDERITNKEYLALVLGCPEWDTKSINSPLTVNGDRSHRTRVLPNRGKPARTDILVIERWDNISKVAAYPKTGYTHQIRAHLSSLGYPILFDTLYQKPDLRDKAAEIQHALGIHIEFKRIMLHAIAIKFKHPAANEMVSFSAPIPMDMADVIAKLIK